MRKKRSIFRSLLRARSGLRDLSVRQDLLEQRVDLDRRAQQAVLDRRVLPAPRVDLDRRALRAVLDPRDLRVRRADLRQRVRRARRRAADPAAGPVRLAVHVHVEPSRRRRAVASGVRA